ncbi:cupin domain-containing protein [Actinokineospora xionganensis]|uniref:Cupin-like domain-containing protein n=1 Tax=Actinokineospora xionganensis TaxID=2684470 RepID=A0ABR7LFW6_9PSEU|nr:cupin domain-containing protein [Actinokineospora xionganensis]MBC6451532.1 cupin-like domain-containing protein [Actinokineospora xionganensis]
MSTVPGGRAGRSTDRPALGRCVAADPEHFASVHWGRSPLLSPAAELPKGFDDLLTLAGVDELLSRRGLRAPFLRVAKNGAVVGSNQFTRGGGVGAEIADQVADDQVTRLFADGHTLVLQGLHRIWPPLIDFAGQLGVDLGHPVQINAYITPPSSRGFAAHYDVHDVFVLQLDGTKRWHIHEPVHRDPLRDQPWDRRADAVAERAEQPPLIDTVLSPGDAIYLPRGYLHSATALGGVSAHLTVGVHVLTRYALAEALLALAADDVELRSTLPLGIDAADPAQLAPHLAETVTALSEAIAIAMADPADVARRVRGRVWQGNRPSPISPLAQVAAAQSVAEGMRVRVRPGLRFRIETAADRVRLELPDDQLSLPISTVPALTILLDGHPCVVGEIPGLPVADQIVLVRRLLREGILVPMGDPV